MSKNLERKETGRFLDDFERSRAFGLEKQTGYVEPVASNPNLDPNRRNTEYASVTGAYPAALPMTISTVGKDEKRVSFTLLINPETWNEGQPYLYQSTYTRSGWVPQLWGPNQNNISSTGRTAAFMSPAAGLDNFARSTTFGYLNFLSLLATYRNNGYKFEDFTHISELTRVVKYVYGVQIEYDGNIISGHFNNFTLDEMEESPFIFNYNFEFISTVLNGSEYELRGHYRYLPSDEKISDDLQLVSDPYVNKPNYPREPYKSVIPPKNIDDRTTIRLWEIKTGRPWSDAFLYNQTDGSVQGNLKLRQKLLAMTSDEIKKWSDSLKK